MQPAKPFYESKTVIVNALLVLVAVLALATDTFNLSAQSLEILGFAVGVVNILLRFVTTQPVSLDGGDINKPLTK